MVIARVLNKKIYMSQVRFDNLTLEAKAKQSKIAGVRELGLKRGHLFAVIIFLKPRIGFLRENHPS